MPEYRDAKGQPCQSDSPDRLLWWGLCFYWTDDWSRLHATPSGIPCCPTCGAVGFQATAKEWDAGARKFEIENPDYIKFLEVVKNRCQRGKTFAVLYHEWLASGRPDRDE